jgi:integrase
MKFERLTRPAMRALLPGQSLTEHGITYKVFRKKGGRFEVNFMVEGERIHRVVGWELDGTTLTTAVEYMEQKRAAAREGRNNLPKGRKLHLTLEAAADQYVQRLKESDGKNLVKKEQHLKLHLKPYFGHLQLTKICETEIGRYKAKRKKDGAAVGTINRELATLSHLLNKALDWGWITSKPRTIGLMKENNARTQTFSPEDCQAILNLARIKDPQVYLFCKMGLTTGMRYMEILSTRIEHISLDDKTIYIWKAKNGPRTQKISTELAEYLRWYLHQQCASDQEWLFPSKFGTKTGHRTCIRDSFRTVVKAAGLDETIYTPHVMRHTVGTQLTDSGASAKLVTEFLGHSTIEMYLRYSHISQQKLQDTADMLEAALKPKLKAVD